ncbi:hypothetical protein BURK_030574 [Burkholderia sp. SJ98]|nr:hypothetical protein BURK_030574 [Burkholderia sp. SJ98]
MILELHDGFHNCARSIYLEERIDSVHASSGDHIMFARKLRLIALSTAILVCAIPNASFATEQAQQRRAGRDVRQDTRQHARHTKQDCRAANQQSNASCRHDKRDTKQQGRQAARNIKY